ncbi:CbtA family protein [Pseudogulbenkiania sp. MAI-1]|uniref:CbtA family protein n=1 Tax=Pseudogulbenkiania sp. MAI-1 TaxID=990370 RepID=UPI00045E61C8|nr:CbtA family protein [Pseudogulbenkiania sp. MAI-1]
MFARIVALSLLGGLLAGAVTTPVQLALVQPLIEQAERYELQLEAAPAPAVAHVHEAHAHEAHTHEAVAEGHTHEAAASDEPSEDATHRAVATAITTTLAAMGYALLLGAVLSQLGHIDWRRGLLFGALGFVVFQLAPSLGLPPEPPGVPTADLQQRQLWWLLTVGATAGALFGLYRAWQKRHALWAVGALALAALPHLVGAPVLAEVHTLVPERLMSDFMLAALATAAVLWLALGGVLGGLFQRFPAVSR